MTDNVVLFHARDGWWTCVGCQLCWTGSPHCPRCTIVEAWQATVGARIAEVVNSISDDNLAVEEIAAAYENVLAFAHAEADRVLPMLKAISGFSTEASS